jgi:hypothetical protein
MLVAACVLLAVAAVVFLRLYVTGRKSAVERAGELERLRDEAVSLVKQVPYLSADRRVDLLDDIDVFSAPVGGMPDVLRAVIRFLPSHYDHDIAGAALVLGVGREQGASVSLTPDDLTASHIELFTLLDQRFEEERAGSVIGSKSKRAWNESWSSAQKDICFALEHLNEYPMLLPIIRDRGVTDVREALEMSKVMSSSDAKALSSGML